MRRAFLPVLWCCLLALLASAAPLSAQSTTGTIQGVVKDNQDAVVPGATVTVRSVRDQHVAHPRLPTATAGIASSTCRSAATS